MKFVLFVALLLSFNLSNLSAQDIDSPKLDLHLNLLPGDSYLYSVDVDQKMTQDFLGEQLEMNQKLSTDYKYTVESNNGDSIKIKASCERMQLIVDYPGDQIEYNSELKGSDGRFSSLDNLIGKSFYLYLDTKGNIYKTEGFEELGSELKSNEFVKQIFTDTALINSLNMDIHPTGPVAMGESWNKTVQINLMNLKLQNNLNYTLEGTSEDIAWINVKGEITGLVDNSDLEMDLKGSQSGTIETDLKSGLISYGEMQTEIEANVQSLGMTSPMKLSTETKISSIKL